MASTDIPSVTIFEDSGSSLMRRVLGNDGVAITQADITTITRNIYARGTLVGEATDIVVADSVFDTLQTDARWTSDSTGYNFRDDLEAEAFPTGDTVYRVEYLFEPESGENFHVVWCVTTKILERS